jgi:hypothetical protein
MMCTVSTIPAGCWLESLMRQGTVVSSALQPPEDLASQVNSATGTRTRVARVRAEYPNQLDYSGDAALEGSRCVCASSVYFCRHLLLQHLDTAASWRFEEFRRIISKAYQTIVLSFFVCSVSLVTALAVFAPSCLLRFFRSSIAPSNDKLFYDFL